MSEAACYTLITQANELESPSEQQLKQELGKKMAITFQRRYSTLP